MKLAIKGHATRGKEVIQLLEMLGGKSNSNMNGYNDDLYYFIAKDGLIYGSDIEYEELTCNYTIFTLEEFEENFPYKVGDKVYNIIHNENQTITEVVWDFQEDEIVYQTNNNDYLFVNYLQPYKEEGVNLQELERKLDEALEKETKESLEEFFFGDPEPEPKAPILSNRYDYAEGKCGYVIPDGYEFDRIKEGFQTEIILKPKKPQYPKTYEECCKDVLGLIHGGMAVDVPMHYSPLLITFTKLLICRDAYWKIAGEQMGLDKPWEPDYDSGVNKYGIISMNGVVQKSNPTTNWERHLNKILDFPTAEMRDAFYENFKDLINETKELL